jgi:putative solute:sodium symporter small subunit
MNKESEKNTSYWKANLKIISWLMIVWFLCSFGFGIIFSDTLDQFRIGGFKLGFWFAQQGSIYIFILLVFVYVYLMNKLDKNYEETEEKD